MRAVEAATIKGGVSSAALMEQAGEKVAEVAMRAWTKRPVAVLCGPGNNGGDGFVVARRIAEAGWPVKVGLLGEHENLTDDAKLMADLYEGEISPFSPSILEGVGLIIDAIFGTGLTRVVEGDYKTAIEAVNAHPAPALAVDIPSGVSADTGAVLGVGVTAVRTVTFFQKKPGHVLFPGRALCGSVDAVEIGITREAAATIKPDCFENQPSLWGEAFGRPGWQSHKYQRGHVMAVSGGALNTGAIRLAAMGALRIGAGLVTILSPRDATQTNAAHLTAIMLRQADTVEEIGASLEGADKYPMTAVIGPAAGIGEATRDKTLAILKSEASAVLDADVLTSFADDSAILFSALREGDVLTPHSGEFERLFDGIALSEGKLAAARAASKKAGCIVVLKGADTVIAAPDGRATINVNAPANLATAGAGDVLAGFIAGLRAQGMPGFEAACAGVWLHGACAQAAGPGLIAEDLPVAVRPVLQSLLAPPKGEVKES
ncbi:MAG: NAD(P)H-hydrate dehydratase [Alphaproteobacteria bacterium]|nr:NAD(P)H-hydrate dehydratase [Alphaproteobacteria bacterium]